MAKKGLSSGKTVKTLTHDEASRKNIPTAEYQSVMAEEQQSPVRVAYERRNRDLDPRLVWRGKDTGPIRPGAPRPASVYPGKGPPQGADR